MVEFALVATVLIVLVMGIINFGYVFGQKLALNQAVREGARAAVVPDGLASGVTVQDKVAGAAGGMLPGGAIATTVSTNCATTAGVGQPLKVVATADNTALLVPMPIPGFPTTVNLSAEAVFRCEF
jgi:Flp pilus assembly protein TadG